MSIKRHFFAEKARQLISTALGVTMAASALFTATPAAAADSTSFSDVPADSYYYSSIQNLASRGIMNGYENGTFQPDAPINRADTVYAFYQMEHAPAVSGSMTFGDVESIDPAYDAILWANQNGIVTGYDAGRFGPKDTLTREQFATILRRYNDYKNRVFLSMDFLREYPDTARISAFAKENMRWAIAEGILKGVNNQYIAPQDSNSRGQAAVILERYENKASALTFTGGDVTQYKLDTYARQIVERYGTDLLTLFNWVVRNIVYVHGPMNLSVEQYAMNAFEQRVGNCLNFAAAFYQIGKYLGLPIRFVQGSVLYTNGTYGVHAWTLINENGKEWVYDPEAQYELGGSFFHQDPNYPRINYIYPAGQAPAQGPARVTTASLDLNEHYVEDGILY